MFERKLFSFWAPLNQNSGSEDPLVNRMFWNQLPTIEPSRTGFLPCQIQLRRGKEVRPRRSGSRLGPVEIKALSCAPALQPLPCRTAQQSFSPGRRKRGQGSSFLMGVFSFAAVGASTAWIHSKLLSSMIVFYFGGEPEASQCQSQWIRWTRTQYSDIKACPPWCGTGQQHSLKFRSHLAKPFMTEDFQDCFRKQQNRGCICSDERYFED